MTSLDRLLRACRAPLVAFSVELGTEAWRLQRTGRVAHGVAYVAERALAAGFEASQVDGILRYERGRGVQGSIFVLQKGRVKVLVAVGPAGGPSDGSGGRGEANGLQVLAAGQVQPGLWAMYLGTWRVGARDHRALRCVGAPD